MGRTVLTRHVLNGPRYVSDKYLITIEITKIFVGNRYSAYCLVTLDGKISVDNIDIVDEDFRRIALTYYIVSKNIYSSFNYSIFKRFNFYIDDFDDSDVNERHCIHISDGFVYDGSYAIYAKQYNSIDHNYFNLRTNIYSIETCKYLLNLYEQKYGRFIPMPLSKIMSRKTTVTKIGYGEYAET